MYVKVLHVMGNKHKPHFLGKIFIRKEKTPQSPILNSVGASLVAQMVKNLPVCRRHEIDPWVGKIPWRRKWQPTPVFLSGEFHGQRKLLGKEIYQEGKNFSESPSLTVTQIKWVAMYF